MRPQVVLNVGTTQLSFEPRLGVGLSNQRAAPYWPGSPQNSMEWPAATAGAIAPPVQNPADG